MVHCSHFFPVFSLTLLTALNIEKLDVAIVSSCGIMNENEFRLNNQILTVWLQVSFCIVSLKYQPGMFLHFYRNKIKTSSLDPFHEKRCTMYLYMCIDVGKLFIDKAMWYRTLVN